MALRSLEDKASLSRRMAEGSRRRHIGSRAAYAAGAADADRAAALIRDPIERLLSQRRQ